MANSLSKMLHVTKHYVCEKTVNLIALFYLTSF